MAVIGNTAILNLGLPEFGSTGWHEEAYRNLRILDAVFGQFIGSMNIIGAWDNSVTYTVGQSLIDSDSGTIWKCEVSHTSPATGTFEADRTANAGRWANAQVSLATAQVTEQVNRASQFASGALTYTMFAQNESADAKDILAKLKIVQEATLRATAALGLVELIRTDALNSAEQAQLHSFMASGVLGSARWINQQTNALLASKINEEQAALIAQVYG